MRILFDHSTPAPLRHALMLLRFLDYRIPVASDLPMIEPVMVEVPNPGHPYGAKGVAEVNICPPMAATCQRDRARRRHAADRIADVAAESARRDRRPGGKNSDGGGRGYRVLQVETASRPVYLALRAAIEPCFGLRPFSSQSLYGAQVGRGASISL
jgi:hypothetical protein